MVFSQQTFVDEILQHANETFSIRLTAKGKEDKRYRKENSCCRCGVKLSIENWPINARKNPRKVWHICEYCFKEKLANNQYKFHTGIVLKKRLKTGKCELCDKKKEKLCWHHWDDADTSKGVWACDSCHWIAESVEKHPEIVKSYLFWKEIAESPRYKTLTFEEGDFQV